MGAGAQEALEPGAADAAQLGGRHVPREQEQRSLGREIEPVLQARMDGDEQIVQPREAAGLLRHEIAPPAYKESQLDRGRLFHGQGTEIMPGADLLGNHVGVAGVALGFAPGRPLTGAIDGEPGHVDHRFPDVEQHGGNEAGNPADHIEPDRPVAAQGHQVVEEGDQLRRGVGHAPIEHHVPVLGQRCDPVSFLRDVDAYGDAHRCLQTEDVPLTTRTGNALHSDDSQSLISGRGRQGKRGDLPPEPSSAASMKTIPAPPGHSQSGSLSIYSGEKGRAA